MDLEEEFYEEFHDDTIEELPVVLEDPKTQVYLPIATTQTKGIASFDAKDFNVDPKGKVALNEDLHQIKENTDAALRNSEEALEQVVEGLGSKVYVNGVLQGSVNVDNDIQEQFDQLTEDVEGIQELVPSQASSQNQLADKNFVNSSINAIAAFYITYDSQGNPFPTKAALSSATTFYSGGETRVPTRNDYCLVLADETHGNASCRYVYTGQYPNGQWDFQFVVNESPLTSDQVAAINSGITSALVQQIPNKADLNNPNQTITANSVEILGNLSFRLLTDISKKVLLDFLHPVNSIIEIEDDTFDPNVYYAGTGSKWVRLPDGYVLWSASSGAGTTIPAGLPNIMGNFDTVATYGNGPFSRSLNGTDTSFFDYGSSEGKGQWSTISFNASWSNGIYGNSNTVQPPARKTCMWKRTA